jgi:hypothetical protein
MINANVIKGVHDLLGEHGLEQKPEERFSDFVARALTISPSFPPVVSRKALRVRREETAECAGMDAAKYAVCGPDMLLALLRTRRSGQS